MGAKMQMKGSTGTRFDIKAFRSRRPIGGVWSGARMIQSKIVYD
jgi:hypothetical protein